MQNFVYVYRCLKIREFRIQSVVGKDSVELEKFALPEEDISTLILLNT
jgi:predicted membrane protein